MAISKRRNRMITFRLSEEEYESLRDLCENGEARSISDLARDAVHQLIRPKPQAQFETALRTLEGRLNNLDLQVQQLSRTRLGESLSRPAWKGNGNV